ncbi:hypothetical protein GCM10022237_08240 [Nocardioides ginsengisoli]|uniref:Uncharacterized protein n=1 Tax=Nocardioides ginsengisoli TaxID=363868 RepID=A0ABW3W1S4_9ACTN
MTPTTTTMTTTTSMTTTTTMTTSTTTSGATPTPAATAVRPTSTWRLVAPWYRWDLAAHPDPARAAEAGRPVLHKFVTSDFVKDFLADPQRSVVFDPAVDVLQKVTAIPKGTVPGKTTRKWIASTRLTPHPSGMRKLFLPAHQRFYVVAVELHCDQPGFPRVDPAGVAEVGFVVRRRRAQVPAELAVEAAHLVRQAKFNESKAGVAAARDLSRVLHPFRSEARARVASGPAALLAAARQAELDTRRLRTWAESNGIEQTTEGWTPLGEGSMGAWVAMPDAPEEVVERTYPMRRLAPDPTDPGHAAHDGTIYYAVVPTSSDEVDDRGAARFNDEDTYEIRVFARTKDGDCPGDLVWSEASQPFRIASFYDPAGCAQRPTEVRLPDFRQLEASDAPPSVRMSAPPNSTLRFLKDGKTPTRGASKGPAQICFFSIPLITIIAFFVLNIFLPVVMFAFGLWWMLKLKFCIPPSIEVEGEISAALDVQPPEIKLKAGVDVDVLPGTDPAQLIDALKHAFDPVDPELGPTPPAWQVGAHLMDGATPLFSPNALLQVAIRNGYGRATELEASPVFAGGVTYTARVRYDEVVHP